MAKGGKTLNDRRLAAEVRTLGLTLIKWHLTQGKDKAFKKALLLKLAPTLLPRINEISGEDGGELVITWNERNNYSLSTENMGAKTSSE